MAQIQWLGEVASDKNVDIPYIANAIKGGVEGYTQARESREKREQSSRTLDIAQSELDLKTKQLEHDYSKLDYDKRKDMYDTMTKLLPSIAPDKQQELTSSPEWMTLEKSLGMPSLSSSPLSSTVQPSWGQSQETASIKADLLRGRGSISTLVGEPLDFQIDTKDKALDYLSKKGRNPAEFATELSKFNAGGATPGGKSPYKEYPDAYLDAGVWKVKRGGKTYKVQE